MCKKNQAVTIICISIYLKGLPKICPKYSKISESFNGEFWQNFQACTFKI